MTKTLIIIITLISILLAASFASAIEVCVAVDFSDDKDFSNDNRYSDCFDVSSGDTALSVLHKTSLTLVEKEYSFGNAICSINGVGDSASNCFSTGAWGFFVANKGSFKSSNEGVSAYKVKDNDVLGFKFDKNMQDTTFPQPIMLRFKDIEVKVDGNKDSGVDETGGRIDKDVIPGSKIKIDFKIENLYESDTNIDIEDVTLDWVVINIDDDSDIDDSVDLDTIDAGKTEKATIEFQVPYEIDEDTYDITIDVEGKDTKGITHKINVEDFTIDVKKENHQLIFTSIGLNPSTLDCTRRAQLFFTVMNIGDDDEDNVKVTATNNALGLSFSDTFDLIMDPFEDDNKMRIDIPITISDKLKAGTYSIDVGVEYNDGKDDLTKTETLTVANCGSIITTTDTPKTEEKKEEVIVVKKPDVVVQPVTTGAVATKIVPQSVETEDNWPIILMALEVIAIIVIVIIIIGVMVRRKNK